jgi:alkyl sulfatase-like protein
LGGSPAPDGGFEARGADPWPRPRHLSRGEGGSGCAGWCRGAGKPDQPEAGTHEQGEFTGRNPAFCIRSRRPPGEAAHLLPKYDDPEFVVRNIWHLYVGWFDGNPAHLKPAPATELATELASLAGGADKLARRAALLAQGGRTRLTAHLAELAAASPQDRAIQAMRASIYERCAEAETSLIGKALFAVYQREAKAKSTF